MCENEEGFVILFVFSDEVVIVGLLRRPNYVSTVKPLIIKGLEGVCTWMSVQQCFHFSMKLYFFPDVVNEPGFIIDWTYDFLFTWCMLVKGFCAGIVVDFN